MNNKILIGKSNNKAIYINSSMLNRHGLIAGATGSGKTVSLKVIAESLSDLGIPLVIPDVKNDLVSLAKKGEIDENISSRLEKLEISDFAPKAFPVEVWDLFDQTGIPIRSSISEMGPLFLSQILSLSEAQEAILNLAFRVADEEGLLLIDIKDLRQILFYINEKRKDFSARFGNISPQSVGAIQRRLLVLEEEGGDMFFGESALDVRDLLKTDDDGRGVINIINAKELINKPLLYSTFLFWILTKLNQILPEVSDQDLPKLVFFFDEAHLLFKNSNKTTIELIERLVKTVRSKGISIFFVSQDPSDIPDSILNQLGNKIQHSMRAYSPKEEKNIKALAQTYRQDKDMDLVEEILNLKVGEAIVSVLEEDSSPTVAEKVTILPPRSFLGPVDDTFVRNLRDTSVLYEKYKDYIDPESAFEVLSRRLEEEKEEKEALERQKEKEKQYMAAKKTAKSFGNSIIRSIGYRIGRDIYGMITDLGKEKNKKK